MTSAERRAQQFQPFDALRGFGEYLRDQERLRSEKIEVSEEEAENISRTLLHIQIGTNIRLRHYSNGLYITTTGKVSDINYPYRYLTAGNTRVWFEDIYKVEII